MIKILEAIFVASVFFCLVESTCYIKTRRLIPEFAAAVHLVGMLIGAAAIFMLILG